MTVPNDKYTLPLNVSMVEIAFGGSNAPICHGAGFRHGICEGRNSKSK